MAIDEVDQQQQVVADSVPFARNYQLEALEKALTENTIVFFETGSGKTLIAIMLLRSYAFLLKKPSSYIAVFLVPSVVLVTQQGEVVARHTDLKVGKYYGELGVDYWDAVTWNKQKEENEVLVMTPQILLDALRHSFLKLNEIKVLIFDECHHAKGKHPYACIMMEFYHPLLSSNILPLPRVFGMTASPIKAKVSSLASDYWKQISELENLMNSKVFTCESESVLAEYIPFSTTKFKMYEEVDIPYVEFERITEDLSRLTKKHELSIRGSKMSDSVSQSTQKRLHELQSTFMFCLNELGIWLAMKAAEISSGKESSFFSLDKLNLSGDAVLRGFSSEAVKVFSAFSPTASPFSLRSNLMANMNAGYLTPKVVCLVETLLDYREIKDLRCIVFVERIVTAIVICNLLNEFISELSGWKTEYAAGNTSRFQSQSRKEQNKIVNEFREGLVNIIVATSMLEEGLDVQSCNLVIRFDPSPTICSFIQSRGRARMKNSNFVIMMKCGDVPALARVDNYIKSGYVMRSESLKHSSLPCEPPLSNFDNEFYYEIKTTGAIVNLSSSVSLLHFYCSRLHSDIYFRPYPRFEICKELESCKLLLPNSCPIRIVEVQGNIKLLKQLACLEACKRLHQCGELTNNLVPKIMEEEIEVREAGCGPYVDEHSKYFPPELINSYGKEPGVMYHCYVVELNQDFLYEVQLQNIVMAVPTRLGCDFEKVDLDLDVDRGKVSASIKYVGYIKLNSQEIALCWRFQSCLFRVLLDQNSKDLHLNDLRHDPGSNSSIFCNYLLLPLTGNNQDVRIDWECIDSVKYLDNSHSCFSSKEHVRNLHTRGGSLCSCRLENSLVCTPHNSFIYCVVGMKEGYDCNTKLTLKDGSFLSYKQYYEKRHGIKLQFEKQTLLNGKHIFTVQNYLQKCRTKRSKESDSRSVELPPEICSVIMSPISISTVYSFSFLPSIMHRIESLLIAANFRSLHADFSPSNVVIPAITILEAITTKNCQEKIHLESLETLGDSFLKYAASQQLFKTFQNHNEGRLSKSREKIISNANLCKLGCDRKLPGFIHNEPFDPKTWIIPGSHCPNDEFQEELISSRTLYARRGRRKMKSKMIADVVEALIGVFLSTCGEIGAMAFMTWLGICVDFVNVPYTRSFPVNLQYQVNIQYCESLLNYKFCDASLLVEALTHGSYMMPDIPRCYQRLEFLGDAVLDFVITNLLYHKYPGLSPGTLTDLRSACTNNDFYAQVAFKAGLFKHILHASQDLHRHISETLQNMDQSSFVPTFNWDSDGSFPKVLGDVIESLAGAIFVDSGYNMETVFRSLKHLIDPKVTPDTLKLHPVRELNDLCHKFQYLIKKQEILDENQVPHFIIEVEANGVLHKGSAKRRSGLKEDRQKAKILASKDVLESLKKATNCT